MERRISDRHRIWFPVRIRSATTPDAQAVTYDASDRGLLLLTRIELAADTRITITMQLGVDQPEERVVEGRVVRSGPNEDDPLGLWRHRLAVEFDAPVDGLDARLVELSADYPLAPTSSRRG